MIDRWGCMLLGGIAGAILAVVRAKGMKYGGGQTATVRPTPLGYDQHTNTYNSKALNVGAGLGYDAIIPSGA